MKLLQAVEKQRKTDSFSISLIQSFLIIFLSEIADRTFILVVLYSLKMHWLPLVICSFLSMFVMNVLAIAVGYLLPMLIIREVVDWIGFCCFLFFGIYSIYDGYTMESESLQEAFDKEKEEDDKKEGENRKRTVWSLCIELFWFLCISELGDKSEISTVTIAAIYNVWGVLFGTSFAYLCTIIIATFLGLLIGKYITERMMCIIGGFLFIFFAIQILVIKIFFS